jgi:hypothetical protein
VASPVIRIVQSERGTVAGTATARRNDVADLMRQLKAAVGRPLRATRWLTHPSGHGSGGVARQEAAVMFTDTRTNTVRSVATRDVRQAEQLNSGTPGRRRSEPTPGMACQPCIDPAGTLLAVSAPVERSLR